MADPCMIYETMFLAEIVESPSNCLHYTKHHSCTPRFIQGWGASLHSSPSCLASWTMFVVQRNYFILRAGPWYLESLEPWTHEFLLILMQLEFAKQCGWVFGTAACVKPAPGSLCLLPDLTELPRAALKWGLSSSYGAETVRSSFFRAK